MTEKQFRNLLEKYRQGLCSQEEQKLLEEFLDSYQPDHNQAQPLKGAPQIRDNVFQNITSQIKSTEQNAFFFKSKTLFLVAAGILTLVLLYFFIYSLLDKEERHQASEDSVIYAKVQTKPNERKSIVLEDGTKIDMNENTLLWYPTKFQPGQKRIIELKGEAFFEVATDSTQEFIVKTAAVETIVLGTTFGIKANPSDSTIAVALVEGRVKVSNRENNDNQILIPGEQITISTENYTSLKSSFKGNLFYAWKENVILFEDATVQEVIETLSQKYKVSFNIEAAANIESLLVYRVDTNTYSLEEVLDHITRVTDYQFIKNTAVHYTVRSK